MRRGLVVAPVALLVAEALLRLAVGRPYPGATLLLLAACGLALLPLMPGALATPSLKIAVLPALAIASLSVVLTTAAIAGVLLTEASIRLAVAAFVVAAVAISAIAGPPHSDVDQAERGVRPVGSDPRREWLAVAALLVVFAFAAASSWDIVYPLDARGIDLWHYLLYADEVEAQQRLLVDDPFAGETGRIFADPPAVGAVYGSFLILDGISSWTLAFGLVLISAISVLSVFAAAGGLWGTGAGLVAAAAYAVAPIRLDLMYWHGLGTALALVFVPLVVLALGLMFRGERGWRATALLTLSLVAVAASHSTSAIVVSFLVVLAPLVDLVRWGTRPGPWAGRLRSWWREGVVRPVLTAVVAAFVLGAGVVAHLWSQAADLGRPVDYRLLGPEWLDREAIAGYYSWPFLLIAGVALALLVASRRQRGDPAVLAVVALALACVVVSQLWRVHFPFEYRRSVYYLGIALVLVIGIAFLRFRPRPVWIAVFLVAFAYVAQQSIGLRLPQRVLDGSEERTETLSQLVSFRDRLDSGELPASSRLVTDRCTLFVIPYLTRTPTLTAYDERQVGFENRLPLARQAAAILEGGEAGRRLAASLGVRYAVVDPRCTPDLRSRLGGTAVVEDDELVILHLPAFQ
jgi:hypothetical protein